jgi:hypothetical protein
MNAQRNEGRPIKQSCRNTDESKSKYKKELLYLVMWTWNVGGLISKIQWKIFKQCVMAQRPDML